MSRTRYVRTLIVSSACSLALMTTTALAQDIDPALASSWAFMQETMPGVSYDLLEAACAEGSLLIYHSSWPEAQEAQVEGFNARFPCIEVGLFGAGMGQLRERFLAEQRASRPTADIYQDTDVGTLNSFIEQGLLADYTVSNDAALPEGSKNSGSWYSLRRAMVGIAWNTDFVSEEEAALLADWEGLLDERWVDRAIVVDPSAGGVAYLPWYYWYTAFGEDFFARIGELNPRVITGINNATAALASGDVHVIVNASETGLLPLWERGAPIQWSLPSPGIGPLTAQTIPANAPHPNAARLYHEYAFTVEGYSLWHELGGAATHTGVDDARPVANESWYAMPEQMFDYEPADSTNAIPEVVEKFNQLVGGSRTNR